MGCHALRVVPDPARLVVVVGDSPARWAVVESLMVARGGGEEGSAVVGGGPSGGDPTKLGIGP